MTESLPSGALIDAQADLLDLYHSAYAAHHGEQGPTGCPCCAEFMPRIAQAMARVSDAIETWRVGGGV